MNPPEKSSDEILQELFGLCQQQQNEHYETFSDDKSSDASDTEENSRQKKHKRKRKKKKKHKKVKKRKDESNDEDSDDKFHKRKLRIKKEPGVDEENVLQVSKVELKIKKEKEESEKISKISNEKLTKGELSQNKENKSNNYINTVTGKPVTLDDVFHTLGIVTEEQGTLKVKQEKQDSTLTQPEQNFAVRIKSEKEVTIMRPDQIKKEKLDGIVQKEEENGDDRMTNDKPESKEESTSTRSNGKPKKTLVSEAFADDADKQIFSSKKINIKNLKNSLVYEATMKEIEEREKQRAQKYEEGELSTDSSSSDEDSVDLDVKDENSHESRSQPLDAHKKRRKSHEKKKKHRSHSRKKKDHRYEDSKDEHRSTKKHKRSGHDHHSSKSHHCEHTRSRSVESESSLMSKRSHRSTHRNRRERSSRDRSRARSRSQAKSAHRKSKSFEKIDKQKLLEIARKNAINLLQKGALPASLITNNTKIASIKAGGKTVDELTDFCKQLSKKEAEGDDSDHFSSGSEDGDKIAFHHPFQLKERPSSIVMNIRNAIPLPTKTAQEKTVELSKQLSLQYPVSSGQQHKSEWIPVEKCQDSISAPQSSSLYIKTVVDPSANVPYVAPPMVSYPLPDQYQPCPPQTDSVIPAQKSIDISSIVAQRLEAIRRLSENPRDPIGANLIQTADSKMTVWAESKVQPGFFTGSTGVKPLSVAELSGGCKAWPKKNQFTVAKPVYSDKGEALMKKMGWQPGEGLGKYKQGPAQPCEISMKTDRKGLAEQSMPKGFKQSNSLQKAIEITQNKHPVSLLNEFCSRRKLPTPQYDCEEKEGTGKRKLFVFSVTVQGVRYTPTMPSTNKKQSKMEAATVCLQSLGLLPIIAPSSVE